MLRTGDIIVTALLVLLASQGTLGLAANPRCVGICEKLREQIPNRLASFNTSLPFKTVTTRWSETSQLDPACVVLPASSSDVALTIYLLQGQTEGPAKCQFSIKSGGHTPWPGANDIQNGISVDLSNLKGINVAQDGSIVQLGPGNTWSDVYTALDPMNISVPGGRCGAVGVGGLAISGGYSFFTPRIGFVADNVENYEVVLASGAIINANSGDHADLFRALKGGGGNNFGIVTRVDIRSFHNRRLWGGAITAAVDPKTRESLLRDVVAFTLASFTNRYTAVQVQMFSSSQSISHNIGLSIVDTSGNTNATILQPFYTIAGQTANTLRTATMRDLADEITAMEPAGKRYRLTTVSVPNDYESVYQVYEVWRSLAEWIPGPSSMTTMLDLEFLPAYFFVAGSRRGDGLFGAEHIRQDQILVLLQLSWTSEVYDEVAERIAKEWYSRARKYSTSFIYGPYTDSFQNPFEAISDSDRAFLLRVSNRYDPGKMFQQMVPGGFKLLPPASFPISNLEAAGD